MSYRNLVVSIIKTYGSVTVFDGEEYERFTSALEAFSLIEAVEESEITWPGGWALILPDLDKDEQIADFAGKAPPEYIIELEEF